MAAAFIHNPELVFLDEPTIGLDVFSKDIISDFLNEIKKEKKTTLLLTTHDLNEISKVCDRAILLDQGTIIIDDDIDHISALGNKKKKITLITENRYPDLSNLSETVLAKHEEYKIIIDDLDGSEIQNIISKLMSKNRISDISISETDFCETVKNIYRGASNDKQSQV